MISIHNVHNRIGDAMFYEISDDIISIEPENISNNFITAGFIPLREMDTVSKYFNINDKSLMQCKNQSKYFRSSIEVCDDYYFATLNLINVGEKAVDNDVIAVFIKKNLFLVVDIYDRDYSVRDKFFECISRFSVDNITIEKLTYAFLESVINGDNHFLEDTEFFINKMEKQVLKNETDSSFNFKLLDTKQLLLFYRNYYEQLIDVSQTLQENENEIFDEKDLKYFNVFINKADRLKDNVDMLRDSVNHLKDAYESSLELKLNQTMKVFTVFTVVFSPLNLIAAWYGMNFRYMPELNQRWGYAFAIGLSLLSIVVVLSIFKKKKWM